MMKKIFYSIVLSIFLLGSANLFAGSVSSQNIERLRDSQYQPAIRCNFKLSSNQMTVDLNQPASLRVGKASIPLGKLSYTVGKARISQLDISFKNKKDPKRPTLVYVYNNKDKLVAALNIQSCSLKSSKLACKFQSQTRVKSFSGSATLSTAKL